MSWAVLLICYCTFLSLRHEGFSLSDAVLMCPTTRLSNGSCPTTRLSNGSCPTTRLSNGSCPTTRLSNGSCPTTRLSKWVVSHHKIYYMHTHCFLMDLHTCIRI